MKAGDRLTGRYKLVERLGGGGMGVVWGAVDEELQRAVAVKVLRNEDAGTELVSRFRREATIGARLRHPRITTVYDIGSDDGRLFIVMELLEGRDLAALLAEHPDGLPVEDALRLGMEVAAGLAAAHDEGVVHRDLKPENIFLHRGRVKICDFGISRSNDSTIGLTGTGRLFGTPRYMAPEQWREGPVDTRCDLYAFGCVLYEMLVGAPPFTGSPIALMRQHTEQRPVPPRAIRPEISRELESLVMSLLEKDPQARPATALHVRTDLVAVFSRPARHEASPLPPVVPEQKQSKEPAFVQELLEQAAVAFEDDPGKARHLANAAVEVAIHVLGPDHADTLAARTSHAYWTGRAGDAPAARDLYKALVQDRTRVLGPSDPSTLRSRHDHAYWTGSAGDAPAARDLYKTLVQDRARVLEPDHPESLSTRHNHAYWTGKAGDAAAARNLYRVLVQDRARVLGPNHPSTLRSRHEHANWTGAARDATAARALYKGLMQDLARVFGPDHPDTLSSRYDHAYWTGEAGDVTAARALYNALSQDCARVLGPNHPNTLRSRQDQAYWETR
ncbi:serine/threonine-protein kinase [Streptomyces sp. NPDC007863]|uniref:serine/threonine-protein kinase n=1 Tax=Streptomyces sp. NPDC007863 TaxID=3154894 RepID=UPI0033C10DB8